MINHLLALLGSVAHGIRSLAASILSFLGVRRLAALVVPALIGALIVVAALSARETAAILGSRPEVERSTLSDVAAQEEDVSGSIWFQFDALVDDTVLEVPADLGTFFYVAVDPADPSTGLLVRSPLNDTFFRLRTLTAQLVDDGGLVAGAREALGALPGGFDLDGARYLDEVASGGEPEEAFVPSQLADEGAGSELLVTGRVVSPATFSACATAGGCEGPDAAWYSYLADPSGGGAIVLRSPHPPDALPMRLEGLFQRDSFDMRPVLESDWFAAIDVDVPTSRSFSAGRRPPITVPASWVPTIIFAALALFLLASQLVGYPVFGGGRRAEPKRTLAPGEGIDLEVTGRLAHANGTLTLDHSPAALERLTMPELARRMWRYGLLPRDQSLREAEERFVAEAGEGDRLVLHERDQSALLTIGRGAGNVQVETGRLYRIGRSAPATHLRVGTTNAYLTTRSVDERDRLAGEIAAEAAPAGG
jgi:hypothetical protein